MNAPFPQDGGDAVIASPDPWAIRFALAGMVGAVRTMLEMGSMPEHHVPQFSELLRESEDALTGHREESGK